MIPLFIDLGRAVVLRSVELGINACSWGVMA
ncbi:hypothetical protein PQA66_gp16 [Yersinia phage vB_YenM_201.16]|uniref:Uncharacterized protein n=1 Tax=Yersinia phage vB_YenM_201.16 TaxID=2918921 RepID=A0AAE9JXK5_9CAUD|nr:hypothetical protein PQA66_gp16 [Yersinia phage vB_YenM_201.16]UNA05959.1 hypothetical protein vBYenM20116_016 [Yersinia phage vB_YenM_201.16]